MTALEDVKARVEKALNRAKRREKGLDFKDISLKESNSDFSLRFLVTKDSGLIDEELKRQFGTVVDIGCSETDGLPEDEGVWPDEDGFHEFVAIIAPLKIVV